MKRQMKWLLMGVLLASLLAACAAPTPQVIEKEVVVEKPVEVARYVCGFCEKEFGTLSELQTHMQTVHPSSERRPVPVAIQVSSIKTKEQLESRANELIKRGLVASVKADLETVGCDYLKELADQGFDIQIPIAANIEGATYEQELATTRERKEALEKCLGKPLRSYGAVSRFSIDGHSSQILDELGAKYIWVSARYEKMPCYTLEPYQEPGPNFVRVLMQSRCLYKPMGVDRLDQTLLAMTGST